MSAPSALSYNERRNFSLLRWCRERWLQFLSVRRQLANLPEFVASLIEFEASRCVIVEQRLGLTLKNLKVLEIGHGQSPIALAYASYLGNEAVGIDLDVVPQGLLDMQSYHELLKRNGAARLVKTVAKEALGYNRRVRREFCRQLGANRRTNDNKLSAA